MNFIPTVWAARLLTALDRSLVYGQSKVVNRDYEGEIRQAGNTVKIASVGDVTIGDYTRNSDIGDPEILSDSEISLSIDQAKYFNFFVDSVDRAQQNVNVLDEAMKRASWKLREAADSHIAGVMEAAVPVGNSIGSAASPVVPTSENAYTMLVDLSVKLDESDTPIDGRFVIVPAWFHGLLLKDERFVSSGTPRADSARANGEVGEAAGFRILKSNNVPNNAGEKFKILAGHRVATSYVEQVLDLQTFKPERRFGDAVKGLHVYGARVTRASSLACIVADKA